MKKVSTAAVVALFYVLISFLLDLLSGDLNFTSVSISHLLVGYFVVFISYLIGVFIVHIVLKMINKEVK